MVSPIEGGSEPKFRLDHQLIIDRLPDVNLPDYFHCLRFGWGLVKFCNYEGYDQDVIRKIIDYCPDLIRIEKERSIDFVKDITKNEGVIQELEIYAPGMVAEVREMKREYDKIEVTMDDNVSVLYDGRVKCFYQMTRKQDGVIEQRFIVKVDLEVFRVIKEEDQYKFEYRINSQKYVATGSEIISQLGSIHHISLHDKKMISMWLQGYIEMKHVASEIYEMVDDVSLKDGIICTNFDPKYQEIDLAEVLTKINSAYEITTNQSAFLIAFHYLLLSLLSYFFRKEGLIFPYLIFSGLSQTGKTTILELFIKTGFGLELQDAKKISNEVKSIFTMTYLVSQGSYPVILDDVSPEFFSKNAEALKGASSSIIFGTRGKADQTIQEYPYRRQLIFTMNVSGDLEIANAIRVIQCDFGKSHKDRQNISEWDKIDIPVGFMSKIFAELVEGKNFGNIITKVREIKNSEEYNQRLIDMIQAEVKTLYSNHNVPYIFSSDHRIQTLSQTDWEMTLIDLLLDQWQYITNMEDSYGGEQYKKHRPYLTRQNLDVEESENTRIIFLSTPGFTVIRERNRDILSHLRSKKDYINESRLAQRPIIITHKFISQARDSIKITISINSEGLAVFD